MPVEIGLGLSPVLPDGRPGTPWEPSALGLRAWYDAELGQPKNVGYVQLDGTSGDYITTPDSAALSFSNDIEVVMRVYCNDWSAAANQTLCAKYVTTGNQRSWRFYSNTSGQILLSVSADGTVINTATITPSVALADATWMWLRLRFDLTNGSNSVGTLETAADNGSNGTEPSSWTANGTATATALAGIFDSTSPLEIGTFQNGTSERFSGRIGRCIVRSGFAGTTLADFNADDCYGPGYTGSLGNVWTLGLPKIYDRSGNGVAPATFGSGSNQPVWLPWLGTSAVYLPGASGNYISCPDAASLGITSDIDIIARVMPTTWSTVGTLVAKYTGSVRSYRLDLNTGGTLRLYLTTDGSTEPASATSSASVGFSTGQAGWVRATWRASDGRVQYFTAADSVDVPTSWTQLGTDKSQSIPSIYSGSAALEVGSSFGGTALPFSGRIMRAIVRNGIDGTIVANFDASLCGKSGYTGTLGNVWTVNRATSGRKAVVQSPVAASARSVILHGTDDYIDVPAAAVPPMGIADNAGIVVAGRVWNTPVNFGRFFSSEPVVNTSLSLSVRSTFVTFLGLSDGTNTGHVNSGPTLTSGSRFVLAADVAARSASGSSAALNTDAASVASSATVGAIAAPTGGSIGRAFSGGSYQDCEIEAIALRQAVSTAVERGQLTAYYRGGL